MGLAIVDGIIRDARINQRLIQAITHGPLIDIVAILLHQTDTSTADATLNGWKNGKEGTGAHLLIDKDGATYQTVPLNRRCYHIAPIRSRCYVEHRCVGEDKEFYSGLDDRYRSKKLTYHQLEQETDRYERAHKSYPARYAGNEGSIGIEVVGMPLGPKDKDPWEKPTEAQTRVTHWLVPALLEALHLKQTDVYRHGVIGFKMTQEAVSVAW